MLNQNRKNMKKSLLVLALAFGVTTAFAQDLTSKKGEPILPEAEDWGIGIDASPFLTYAQGIFGKTSTTSVPTWDFMTSNQTITVKYFKDEKTAYRAAVRLGFGSQTWKNIVDQDASTTTPKATVVDVKKTSTSGIGISGGIEMRKGKTRLQGYYGAEVGIFFGSVLGHDKYTYGNPLNISTGGGTSTTSWSTIPNSGSFVGSRTTDLKNGSTFQFALRGFIGAEYFFMPKMSLGGEFGWGLGFTSTGEGSQTTETVSATSVTSTTTKVAGSSKFGLDTDNWNSAFGKTLGALRLNLYF